MAITETEANALAAEKYIGDEKFNGLAAVKGGWFVKINLSGHRGSPYTFLDEDGNFVTLSSNRGPDAAIKTFAERAGKVARMRTGFDEMRANRSDKPTDPAAHARQRDKQDFPVGIKPDGSVNEVPDGGLAR